MSRSLQRRRMVLRAIGVGGTVPATEPGAPTIGTATRGNGQVAVAFTAPASDGGATITSYTATSSPGGFTGTGASSPVVVSGLTNGTAYTFTVTATNSVGTGPASAASNSATPATTPGAPTIGTATAGDTTATANWTAPASNGGEAITGYEVKTYQASNDALLETNNVGLVLTFQDTGRTNGTGVYFKVAATNAVGTGAQSAASNTVTPTAPVTFTFNPSAEAGSISSNSTTSYANARSGADTLSAAPGATIEVGQIYQAFDPDPETGGPETWLTYEGFLDFSLATITGTVSSATLSVGLLADNSGTDFTLEARNQDWGATLTTADFVAGASLGTPTLLATLATSGIGATGAYKAMVESGTALKDAVIAAGTGTLRIILCSDRHRGNNTPTGQEQLQLHQYNHASFKPKLVVVTTT